MSFIIILMFTTFLERLGQTILAIAPVDARLAGAITVESELADLYEEWLNHR